MKRWNRAARTGWARVKQDPAKARAFLTAHSHRVANGAVDAYRKLAEDLWSKYTNQFDGPSMPPR